jgi:hypothetical protein
MEESSVAVPPSRSRRPILRLLVAVLLGLTGVFVSGAYVGWSTADVAGGRSSTSPGPEDRLVPEVIELRIPTFSGDEALPMPDVRGLDLETALAVLSDTVLRGDEPMILSVPWAGPPGIVVGQHPAFGARSRVGVRILVSESAVVPAVVGLPVADVVRSLQELGAQVEVVRRFEPNQPLDVVVGIEPAPGLPLPDTVRVTASERRGTLFLTRVPQVAGPTCGRAPASIGGQQFAETLRCPIGLSDRDFEWVLSRVVGSLEGSLGLPDEASSDAVVRFEVIGDGEMLLSGVATYGSPFVIDIPTPDVLRLTIRARAEVPGQRSFFTSTLVLAEIRLVGGAEALASIQTNQR